ncbi:hypothetical protein E2562_016845 [Oryza meyeriana var. granulata]|uniref:F-box domain-containing protein n=1 Tax=Oryza meyeriana var. granulata TaxID=110450 RepID=A0A6G1BWP5_9ORYZ|nr:hypothetical protein E2562_016845 [Oryza meyeriana var. granulata]
MDFDCSKARGDSSSVNRSCIATEGILVQAKSFTHCRKAKQQNSVSTLNNQKCSYESLSEPKKNVGTNDNGAASVCDSRCFTDLPAALVCEVLERLDPKELGIVSCVSTLLHTLATDHQGWKKFYCERWGLPSPPVTLNGPLVPGGTPDWKSWKTLFVEREFRSKSFLGRFSVDVLRGHSEDVRTVFLLASANLIFTGGNDSVIRMWDMEEGLLIDKSRPLCCTIRAIAADTRLLVTAGTNAFIQCWRAVEDRIVCGGEDGAVKVWNFSEALEIEKRAQALRSMRQENRMRRKKAQVEMNANGRRSDQCSIAMKRNQLKGDKSVTWHSKRAVNDKLL